MPASNHPYLKVKNICVVPDDVRSAEAMVIDVYGVPFGDADDRRIVQANLMRFTRSLPMWRDQRGLTSRIRTCGCLTWRSVIRRNPSGAQPAEAAGP